MVFAELASDIETEEKNKWSTTSNSELLPSFEYFKAYDNKRTLKLSYDTTAERYALKGIDGVDFDHTTWSNPYGTDSGHEYSDISWATNIGMWIYTDTHDYNDDSTMFKVLYHDVNNNGPSYLYWNSSVGETNKWVWFDDELTTTNKRVDRVGIGIDKSESGNIYINTIVIFKRKCSNAQVYDASDNGGTNAATGEYTFDNGLKFTLTGLENSDNSIKISGLIHGSDYREVERQLMMMKTTGVTIDNILGKPMPKVSSMSDFGEVKPYLFYSVYNAKGDSSNKEMAATPVVISSLSTTHPPGKTGIISFTAVLIKLGGV